LEWLDQNILGKEWLWGMALGWLGNGFWVCWALPKFKFTSQKAGVDKLCESALLAIVA